jgi:hypothetical protein
MAEEVATPPENIQPNETNAHTKNTPEVNFTEETAPEDSNINDAIEMTELTAIEKLEIEMEKERATQLETNPISEEKKEEKESPANKSDDEWASDIEKLKQEAGIAINQES